MKMIFKQLTILGLLVAVPSVATAGSGLCRKSSRCGDYCCAERCEKKCVGECKSVTETKHCWNTECDEVCVPPVRLPCCKCLLKGMCGKGKCGSCCSCGDSGCCDSNSCRQDPCCREGLLHRLFSKCAGCRIRCVSRLKKHEYDCEKNVIEWKVACGGGCCSNDCCETGAHCAPACCAPDGCQ